MPRAAGLAPRARLEPHASVAANVRVPHIDLPVAPQPGRVRPSTQSTARALYPAHRVPTLAVYSLSDAFSAIWPALAEECGLALEMTVERDALNSLRGAVGLVVGGGVEESLELTLRAVSPADAELAAVGSLPSHH